MYEYEEYVYRMKNNVKGGPFSVIIILTSEEVSLYKT